jgi:hypothetical protein
MLLLLLTIEYRTTSSKITEIMVRATKLIVQ